MSSTHLQDFSAQSEVPLQPLQRAPCPSGPLELLPPALGGATPKYKTCKPPVVQLGARAFRGLSPEPLIKHTPMPSPHPLAKDLAVRLARPEPGLVSAIKVSAHKVLVSERMPPSLLLIAVSAPLQLRLSRHHPPFPATQKQLCGRSQRPPHDAPVAPAKVGRDTATKNPGTLHAEQAPAGQCRGPGLPGRWQPHGALILRGAAAWSPQAHHCGGTEQALPRLGCPALV